MKTLITIIFYTALVLFVTSCWQRNDFPEAMPLTDGVDRAPLQTAVSADPFTVTNNDVEYRIKPRYQYDLRGVVVSYAHHDGNYSLHRLWNDHINVTDVCVVWGDNAEEIDLNDFKFRNGKFTCNYSTHEQVAWEQFREDQISNNHLLTENKRLRRKIDNIRIGDQVRIRGWLAAYSNNKGFERGTSTTRDDTGNGACETVYVKDFQVLQSMSNRWRTLMNISAISLVFSGMFWLVAVMRGVF